MAFFNTEMTTEIILFSVDAVFSILLLKGYNKTVRYIKCLQCVSKPVKSNPSHDMFKIEKKRSLEVTSKGENKELDDVRSGDKRYMMVQGPVKALGNTIPSAYVPSTFGVVQKMSTSELVMARNSSGYWWDESRPIHQSYNVVPFAIIVGKHVIEVQDVLLADELHLDTVYNKYDRTVHSFAGNLWSFFAGVRQYGLQTTEEMLKEGTVVTGVGELAVLENGSKSLMPPGGNKPYFVTTQSIATLLKDLRHRKSIYGGLLLFTGTLTVVFGSMLCWRLWKNLRRRREKLEMRRRLEASRRSRRQNARNYDENLPDALRCVVCQENPKEVIMLPCGHLCACEDCSERLGSNCPICRAHIVSKAAAFLS